MARRYFVRPLPLDGRTVLDRELGHHVARVLRAVPGDVVVLFDGLGREVDARISRVSRATVEVEIGPARGQPLGREPATAVHVAVALPKGQRAHWLFEHGTEIGIRSFRPLSTARATQRPDAGQLARWQRIVQAACGQCDRALLPDIEPLATIAELARAPTPVERYVAVPGAPPLGAARSAEALLVVGPEGGLLDGELDALREAGFVARGLGPLTLRTETAVLVGAARLLLRETASDGQGTHSVAASG